MGFGDLAGEGETDAGAAGLRGVEGDEEVLGVRQARPLVLHPDLDVRAGDTPAHTDQPPRLQGGVDRVPHQVDEELLILQGRIEGLLDGVYPRDEPHLAELLDETRHLARLVEDLGTLAHAEAGALELRKEPVDLGDLVRDIAASLPRPVVVDVPAELPAIEVDPVRIRQVLLNLLANALRHTPAEGLRHRAGGPAPPLRALPQKGSDSRGTRKLVLAHGGDIGVESVPGRGTEVTVALPR